MAAVIPEAAETVTAGTEAVEGAGARAAAPRPAAGPARAGGLPGGQRRSQQGSGRSGDRRRSGNHSRSGEGSRKRSRGRPRSRPSGTHTYQPVILAEFVVAIVIVSVSPVARGGTPESQAKGSPSPYSVNTLKQLVAIGGAYFVLAILASSQRAGRYAAWFGGLILLGLGFAQLANGDLKALFKVFGPSSGAAAPGAVGTATPAAPNLQDSGGGTALVPVPDATGNFPVINPSTTQSGPLPGITQGPPPGVAANPDVTQTTITPPPGGVGVITT